MMSNLCQCFNDHLTHFMSCNNQNIHQENLLGAHFMEINDMLIDCRRKCLQLSSNAVEVPFIDSHSSGVS